MWKLTFKSLNNWRYKTLSHLSQSLTKLCLGPLRNGMVGIPTIRESKPKNVGALLSQQNIISVGSQ